MAIIMSLAETMAEQVVERIDNSFAAIDLVFEKHKLGVFVATILLVVLGACLDTALAWLPLCILYWCAILTTKHHFVGHRRLGLLFIVIGFCVGGSFAQDSGHDLIGFGKTAHRDSIFRAYSDHPWLVLGVTLGIDLLLSILDYPIRGMIRTEVRMQFVGCVLNIILTGLVR